MGRSLNLSLITSFRDFVSEAELVDIPLLGGKFTWGNNLDPPTFVRLDRFLFSTELCPMFLDMVQNLLEKSLSDHNAISIKVDGSKRAAKAWADKSLVIDRKRVQFLEKEIHVLEGQIQA
ncbi:hypothetical protein V6N12_019736 [Hibiscus sabdariffa]|uniref:Uncharacterized protein n=1 Tax=Hibiscus sabdariffa TaxID=183260 RepID=A0ABR2AP69_9ROSI